MYRVLNVTSAFSDGEPLFDSERQLSCRCQASRTLRPDLACWRVFAGC